MKAIGSFFIVSLYFGLVVFLTGCRSIQRHTVTGKKTIKTLETGTRKIITKGDSIVYVPRISYKDTIITRVHKNIVLTTEYKNGKVTKVNCEEKAKEIIENYVKQQETKEQNKEKEVKKDPVIKDIYFLYIGIILIVLLIVNKIFKR